MQGMRGTRDGARGMQVGMAEEPARTPDGHHVIVNGRKWRASDPAIPDPLRQELVDELMAARRAVKAQETDARRRVQDAKVALGERGPSWWEPLSEQEQAVRIEATMRALLRKREGRTICPSDVARVVGGEQWRDLMDAVRALAADRREQGQLLITQRGEPAPAQATGPIRLARGSRFDDWE